jgi:hypothetical protein
MLRQPLLKNQLATVLQPSLSPVHKGVPTNITITFLTLRAGQKGGNMLQPHVDYDVTILKDGKQEFQVSAWRYHNLSLHISTTRRVYRMSSITLMYFTRNNIYIGNLLS